MISSVSDKLDFKTKAMTRDKEGRVTYNSKLWKLPKCPQTDNMVVNTYTQKNITQP